MSTFKIKLSDDLIEKINLSLMRKKLKIEYKIWLDKTDRDLGEAIFVSSPQNLSMAIYQPTVSYENGGCLEIVIDNDEKNCIYHYEENEEYLCKDILDFLDITVN